MLIFSLLGQQRSLCIRGAINQKSTSLNPFDSKHLPCCCISILIDCLQSVSMLRVSVCLPVVSIVPLSQMSDTRAASWQWMQMMPLTLWSPPPAETLHQHSALPGSGCRCCPFWCVQKFFLLSDCGSLHWWCCSGECCAVTLWEIVFVLVWCATVCDISFILYFSLSTLLYSSYSTCFLAWSGVLFYCHACGVCRLFWIFFLPLWRSCDLFPCPMTVCDKKIYETVTVIEMNLTSEVPLIEISNPAIWTTQTIGEGKTTFQNPPPESRQPVLC